MSRAGKTTLTLTAAEVAILLGVIGFASESDSYESEADQARLEQLWHRLEAAAARLNS